MTSSVEIKALTVIFKWSDGTITFKRNIKTHVASLKFLIYILRHPLNAQTDILDLLFDELEKEVLLPLIENHQYIFNDDLSLAYRLGRHGFSVRCMRKEPGHTFCIKIPRSAYEDLALTLETFSCLL